MDFFALKERFSLICRDSLGEVTHVQQKRMDFLALHSLNRNFRVQNYIIVPHSFCVTEIILYFCSKFL